MTKTLLSSALLSALLVLPFIVLQLVNRREFNEDFPFMLFFVMWLNWFALSAILAPVVRTLREGGSLFAHPIHFAIVALLSLLFAVGTFNLVVDQWPCFMGVQNCD